MNINHNRRRMYRTTGSFAAAALLAVMLAVIAGCGSSADKDTAGHVSDNNAASQSVTASLASEPMRNPYEAAGVTDPAAFDRMFAQVQTAVASGDKAAVAALALYPVRVNFSAERHIKIDNTEQFIAKYDQIITPAVKEALRNQKPGELFVNAKGVMAGAGQMWFGATASTPQKYGIIAVNP